MIDKTSCQLARVFRDLWARVMFREFSNLHSPTAHANLIAFYLEIYSSPYNFLCIPENSTGAPNVKLTI